MKLMAMHALSALALTLLGTTRPASIRGSGVMKTETRSVGDFTSLSMDGVAEVTIEQTGVSSLTVEADDNLLERIATTVSEGELRIAPRTNIAPTKPVRYTITVKDLHAIDLGEAITGELRGLRAEKLSLRQPGRGRFIAKSVEAKRLSIESLGIGELQVAGAVGALQITASGSGVVDADGLPAKAVMVTSSGSGRVVVRATETLSVTLSASGSVEYSGAPRVTQAISGSGRLVRRGSEK